MTDVTEPAQPCRPEIRSPILAVDFDDTLFTYVPADEDYSGRPDSIGEPIQFVIDAVLRFKARGGLVILWTCREGVALEHALESCQGQGLVFDAVNANVPSRVSDKWPDCRKVKADFYLDDKAVNPFKLPIPW